METEKSRASVCMRGDGKTEDRSRVVCWRGFAGVGGVNHRRAWGVLFTL